jgi:hypothetical protein
VYSESTSSLAILRFVTPLLTRIAISFSRRARLDGPSDEDCSDSRYGGERKKLDQGSGPPEVPLILPDGTGPHPDREAAEHPYPESLWFMIHHCCLLLAAMIIMEVDRDYPPAKQGPQTESTASFALLGTPSPGRVAPTGPACVS